MIQSPLDDRARAYSPPLDGIRAFAVLAVVVFHVAPGFLTGGFTGVDVFFALSGFLLGSIILGELEAGAFSLREFYLRRIQRLAPELILTVFVVLALWLWFFPPSAAQDAARHGVWTLANLSNFYVWQKLGGYWGESSAMAPLLHTWSLAVEEQFYLVFPALMILLMRMGRRSVRPALLLLAALSLGLCVTVTPRYPDAAFQLLPTRLWELLVGAAVATAAGLGRAGKPSLLHEASGWVGLATICAGFATIGEKGFPGLFAVVPIAGTLLVILAVSRATNTARLLSTPPLVWLGKRSYAIYLWHWPLIILGRFEAELHRLPALAGAIAGAIASFLAASAAYALVEQPLRARGPGRMRRLTWIAAGFVACFGAAAAATRFTPQVETSLYLDPQTFFGRWYSAGVQSNEIANVARLRDVYLPSLTNRGDGDWRSGGLLHLFGGLTPDVVLLGSSHGTMYAKVIDSVCEELKLSIAFLAVDGAPVYFSPIPSESFPTMADSNRFNAARMQRLASWHPRAVFLVERWDTYASSREEFARWLQPLLEQVSPFTERMLLVAQPPVIAQLRNDFNVREWAVWRRRATGRLPEFFPDENEDRRKLAAAMAEQAMSRYPNLRVLRPDRAFYQPDGSIRWRKGRTVYYTDDDHLSEAGAESVREIFRAALAEAAKRQN